MNRIIFPYFNFERGLEGLRYQNGAITNLVLCQKRLPIQQFY